MPFENIATVVAPEPPAEAPSPEGVREAARTFFQLFHDIRTQSEIPVTILRSDRNALIDEHRQPLRLADGTEITVLTHYEDNENTGLGYIYETLTVYDQTKGNEWQSPLLKYHSNGVGVWDTRDSSPDPRQVPPEEVAWLREQLLGAPETTAAPTTTTALGDTAVNS